MGGTIILQHVSWLSSNFFHIATDLQLHIHVISYFYKFIAIAFDHKQSYWSNQHKQIYMYIYWFIVYLGIGVLDPWLLNNLIELTSFKSCAPYLEASFWSRSTSCPNDIDQANIIGGGGGYFWYFISNIIDGIYMYHKIWNILL